LTDEFIELWNRSQLIEQTTQSGVCFHQLSNALLINA
jgi:hypothetical protein